MKVVKQRTRLRAGLCAAAVLLPVASDAGQLIHAANGYVEVFGAPPAAAAAQARPGFDKLDGYLVEIAAAAATPAGADVGALEAAEPQATFLLQAPSTMPAVQVEALAQGAAQNLLPDLLALGFSASATVHDRISGWLPVDRIAQAAALPGLRSLRLSEWHTRAGAVMTQGDLAIGSQSLRQGSPLPGLSGSGVTVGIISDSFDCLGGYAADIDSGDLPDDVTVLKDALDCLHATDEGRAVAQIVHDVAPDAKLLFYSGANGEADFAYGIQQLAGAGANVIVDDLGYYDEPMFQDGLLTQAVDAVEAQGVAYFSAAGNQGRNSFEGAFIDSGVAGGYSDADTLMNFDASQATDTTTLPVTVPAQGQVHFLLHWDQPYATGGGPGASSTLDLCLVTSAGTLLYCSYPTSDIGQDPFAYIGLINFTTQRAAFGLQVGLREGPAPDRVKITYADDGSGGSIDAFKTDSPTLQGHPGAAGAMAVGAAYYLKTPACGTSPAIAETDSAWGGVPILFDQDGARLDTPLVRYKPDIVGPDGVQTTFYGIALTGQVTTRIAQCQYVEDGDNVNYPGFYGTSAAAAHAAGLAALLLQALPNTTPERLYAAMRYSGSDMATPGFDFQTGYGFINANVALARLENPGKGGGGGGAFGMQTLLGLLGLVLLRRIRGPA